MTKSKRFLKQDIIDYMDQMAGRRDRWIRRNRTYYRDLLRFLHHNIFPGSSILEVGCGTGHVLHSLRPGYGVGIDVSGNMIDQARTSYPELEFHRMDAEAISLDRRFDYIIISDTIGYFEDIQKVFKELVKVCCAGTRLIITSQSFFWLPLLRLAEILKLKMASKHINWLNIQDITNLLELEGFQVIKSGRRFLFPFFFPLVSWLCNRCIVHLPLINRLGMIGFLVARQVKHLPAGTASGSVSIIIPARNEQRNIHDAILSIPHLCEKQEVIFIEGHSKDDTLAEIRRVCREYSGPFTLRYAVQEGIGKADAVRKGYEMAGGDICMILDADLTVPPEDLIKFYDAIAGGEGEFINGSRLIYPMEKEAMRTLNIMGNKFFSVMFSWLLGQRIKDTLCGTKVIRRADYQRIKANRTFFGDFDPFGDFDLLFGAAKLNLKIVEVPIRYRARAYGDTNISRFRHGLLLLRMVFVAMGKIKFI